MQLIFAVRNRIVLVQIPCFWKKKL